MIRWVATGWDQVSPITIVRSWRKLLEHKATDHYASVDENLLKDENLEEPWNQDNDNEILPTIKKFPEYQGATLEYIDTWMATDDDMKGITNKRRVSAGKKEKTS